ncbi:MAG: hypothetical protein DME19_16435 [Verrucomicrobia bacterium]|nr:MAG: hypothetical protein DME19_16435 [Verrucomicrobiota bacterium]
MLVGSRKISHNTIAALHEPQKVAQASCLFGTDRLEACSTLQPAPRFMAATPYFGRCSLSLNPVGRDSVEP